MRVIEVEHLSKVYHTRVKQPGLKASVRALIRPQYRDVQAVQDVGFSVEAGEMLAFIGPNGAGKSTTIKMLTGILTPTRGDMRVMGLDPIRQRQQLGYEIGTVFGQKSQLWFHLPPADSFQLLGAIYDIDAPTLKARMKELTDRFDLGPLMDTPVRKLSLGQRIRCEVAASFLHRPAILFLDEPTIGLDILVKQQLRDVILSLNKEHGTTVFLTSHDAGDVEQLCRRAMVIDQGTVVLDQPVKTLKHTYFRRKVISVRFDAPIALSLPAGVTLEKEGRQSARLAVDTGVTAMDEVMRWLVSQGLVSDITVQDPPMEQIIADIFRSKGGHAHAEHPGA